MGKNMLRLLKFAIRFPGWHSYGTDRSTREAVNKLVGRGFLEHAPNSRQFRLALDAACYAALKRAFEDKSPNFNHVAVVRDDYKSSKEFDDAAELLHALGFDVFLRFDTCILPFTSWRRST